MHSLTRHTAYRVSDRYTCSWEIDLWLLGETAYVCNCMTDDSIQVCLLNDG